MIYCHNISTLSSFDCVFGCLLLLIILTTSKQWVTRRHTWRSPIDIKAIGRRSAQAWWFMFWARGRFWRWMQTIARDGLWLRTWVRILKWVVGHHLSFHFEVPNSSTVTYEEVKSNAQLYSAMKAYLPSGKMTIYVSINKSLPLNDPLGINTQVNEHELG